MNHHIADITSESVSYARVCTSIHHKTADELLTLSQSHSLISMSSEDDKRYGSTGCTAMHLQAYDRPHINPRKHESGRASAPTVAREKRSVQQIIWRLHVRHCRWAPQPTQLGQCMHSLHALLCASCHQQRCVTHAADAVNAPVTSPPSEAEARVLITRPAQNCGTAQIEKAND